MGSVSVGTVSIFVSTCGGEGVNIRLRCMRVGTYACVYVCLSSTSMCQVGALDSASLIILVDPHPPPCPAGGGCRRCVGDFSRRGRMLGRAPAHSRRSIGGAWPYWPCWAPIVGWGAFGSPGPGPGPPWCGRLPVEPAGLPPRHPGAPTLWLSEVPPSGSSSALSGWRAAVVPAVVLLGSRALGGLRIFGARVFSVPASWPCGMGLLFPTHTIKHLHGGTLWNTSALTHTGVHSSIHIGVKTGAHRHPLSWSAVASKLIL